MAVDNKKLVYLIDPFWQGEGINGKPLVAGYMCVYHAGTNTPYITYQNFDGTRNPFKIPLNNDGRATILAEPYYKYDCYLYDSFGNLACSRLNVMPQVGGDVSVSGFTEVWHDDTLSGEGTPQSPLTVIGGGGSGKTYSGIDPIVVNNEEDKISANTVPFGVQEPLYFVEDETATIIGISGNPSADAVNWVTAQGYLQRPDLIGYATTDFVEEEVSGKYDTSAFSTISGAFLTAVPGGTMNESAFGYSGGLITSYNGSAFKAGDEFPQSATDAIQVVTSNSGNWDDSYSAVTSNSASWNDVSGKLDESAFSSVSGDFQTTAGMTGYTTKDDISGLQSASTWNDAVNTVSSNSASWTGIEYTGVSPIVVDNTSRSISADTWTVNFGSGLSAIDDTANSATTIVVTAQGGSDVEITPILASGTKIAEYSIDGVSGELFAPEGGSASWSEEYVDIPWRIWSTTTTTWQTIIDYASAHNGIPPKGICTGQDNAIFYPVRFHTGEFNEIYYQAIYHYAYDQTNGGVQNRIFSKKLTPDGWSKFTETLTDQADWNETGTSNWSYIRNKPHIPEIELDASNQVSAIDGYTLAGGGPTYSAGKNISIAGDIVSTTDVISVTGDVQVENSTETEVTSVPGTIWGTNYYGHVASLNSSYKVTVTGTPANLGVYVYDFDHGGYYVNGLTTADLQNFTITGLSSLPNAVTSKQGDWSTTDWFEGAEFGIYDSAYNPGYDEGMPAWPVSSTLYSLVGSNISLSGLNNFVETNSANWDGSYDTLTANSANWTAAGNTLGSNSGKWNQTYNTVSSNSATWGGSVLNVSAGPGVKINLVNDTLVFSNDETVLYSGAAGYNTEMSLTDPTSAFETVKFYWAGENGAAAKTLKINEFSIADTRDLCFDGVWQRYSNGKWNFGGFVLSANADLTKYIMSHNYRYNLSGSLMDVGNDASNFAYVCKVVGVNRTAGNS